MKRQMESDPVIAMWQTLRDRHEGVKNRIQEEIRNYPPPITACDAQFNHLLEERAEISRELGRLEGMLQEHPKGKELTEAIGAFVKASPFIDGETE